MPSERNNIIPVFSSPEHSSADVKKLSESSKKKKNPTTCYIASATVFIVITIIILAVSFTVFKIRDPTMIINKVHMVELDLTKNLSVVADVTVRNPNALTFSFNSSTTTLLYRDSEVGLAYGPPGVVVAHKELRTNVSVDMITNKLLNDSSFMDEIGMGSLGLQTSTAVGGNVKILGVFKRHVDVVMNCTVNVSIASQEILGQQCTQRMWI